MQATDFPDLERLHDVVHRASATIIELYELFRAAREKEGEQQAKEALPTPFASVVGVRGTFTGPVSRRPSGLRVVHHFVEHGHVNTRIVDVLAVQQVEFHEPHVWEQHLGNLQRQAVLERRSDEA